jgi:MarR family transcriptional regulator, organic hydroperoxide resistance regulator
LKAGYHPPLSISRRALLVRGSDAEFRRLLYRLVLVEERLRHARAYFGRRIGLSGPQYMLLITVGYLQGAQGIPVRSLARDLRVTSAFITGESRRLIERGLLAKRTNPQDSRSTLLSLTAAGRQRIEGLVPEIRRVNNLFFGHLSKTSFRGAKRLLDELAEGSAQALAYIAHREGRHA